MILHVNFIKTLQRPPNKESCEINNRANTTKYTSINTRSVFKDLLVTLYIWSFLNKKAPNNNDNPVFEASCHNRQRLPMLIYVLASLPTQLITS